MCKIDINPSTFPIPLAIELKTFRGSIMEENPLTVTRPDCMLLASDCTSSVAEAVLVAIEKPSILAAALRASAILPL
jgi:hypothetical protein